MSEYFGTMKMPEYTILTTSKISSNDEPSNIYYDLSINNITVTDVKDGQGNALYVDMLNDDLFNSTDTPCYVNNKTVAPLHWIGYNECKKTILYYFDNGDYIYMFGIHINALDERVVFLCYHRNSAKEIEYFNELFSDKYRENWENNLGLTNYGYQIIDEHPELDTDFVLCCSNNSNPNMMYQMQQLKDAGKPALFLYSIAKVTESTEILNADNLPRPTITQYIINSCFSWIPWRTDNNVSARRIRSNIDGMLASQLYMIDTLIINKDNTITYPVEPLKENTKLESKARINNEVICNAVDDVYKNILVPKYPTRALGDDSEISKTSYSKVGRKFSNGYLYFDTYGDLITSHINTTGTDGYFNPEVYDIPINRDIDHDPNSKVHPDDDDFTGGGDGDYDYTSDDITLEDEHTNLTDLGLFGIYKISKEGLNTLADTLWSNDIFDQIGKKLTGNPIDAIISLNQYNFNIPASQLAPVTLKFGDSEVYLQYDKITDHVVTVDCGLLQVIPFTKSALDYSPYTSAQLYLPYIGYKSINIDEIMCKTLKLKYKVDLLTGMCLAILFVDDSVLYQFNGHCGQQIALTGRDSSQLLQSLLRTVAVTGAIAGSGGFGAGAVATTGAADLLGVGQMAGLANSAMSGKTNYEHSGSFNGVTGQLGVQKPYIIFNAPNHCSPKNYQNIKGFPYMSTQTISKCTGFTVIHDVRLSNLSCTDEEKEELYTILKKGVII